MTTIGVDMRVTQTRIFTGVGAGHPEISTRRCHPQLPLIIREDCSRLSSSLASVITECIYVHVCLSIQEECTAACLP